MFVARPDLGFALLADGMGGTRAGGVAADAALEHLTGVLKREPLTGEHLSAALRLANARVLGMSNAVSAYRGMGTTLVAAAINGSRGYIAMSGIRAPTSCGATP